MFTGLTLTGIFYLDVFLFYVFIGTALGIGFGIIDMIVYKMKEKSMEKTIDNLTKNDTPWETKEDISLKVGKPKRVKIKATQTETVPL